MKLLLVDDSSTMRRIQKNQLTALGVSTIVEADDGAKALEALSVNPAIDTVLLDWNMPEMNGLACLQKIRQNPSWSKVKVVMCTSESDKGRVMEAMAAGANNYIVKPFTPETIKEKLGL
jgi:two-component system, chemotaxis family, chemotaxis protein CheY